MVQTKYTVEYPNGVIRRFAGKEAADAAVKRYGAKLIESPTPTKAKTTKNSSKDSDETTSNTDGETASKPKDNNSNV